jgi:hypothetical protein
MAGLRASIAVGVAVGVGVGLGLAVMAPGLFPRTARAARPFVKKAALEGMEAYLRAREGVAEFGEFAEDLLAEVEAEVVAKRRAQDEAPTPAAAGGNGRDPAPDDITGTV